MKKGKNEEIELKSFRCTINTSSVEDYLTAVQKDKVVNKIKVETHVQSSGNFMITTLVRYVLPALIVLMLWSTFKN